MTDTLKVYKGDDVVGTAERGEDGKAKVTVDGLDANTDYATGTYQVSFSNENGESEKVDVPSFKTKPIAVTGVTVEPKTATLDIDGTQQLTATVAPANASDKTVTYASNAQGIASVDDNGLITGKAEGTTQIVVTTKDGNKSATCDVTVNPPEPEPEPEVPEEPEE